MVLLDGLYPNGPLMQRCQRYHWQFMIVLPTKCLPTVWEEIQALKSDQAQYRQSWQGREQQFWWVNDILYSYDHERQSLPVHVLGCDERWQSVDPDSGQIIDQHTQHVWLSSQRLCRHNVHERANLGARRRWGIETSMQIEKCHGYHYEHAFSQNWNAMRGYHYLMRLAHLFNALALATKRVRQQVRELGVQAFLLWVRDSCAHRWLSPTWLVQLRQWPPTLRLE
jgi:hypothetical protein